MTTLHIKPGEAFSLEFRLVDGEGKPVDASSAELSFVIKEHQEDVVSEVEHDDLDVAWDRTREGDGIIVLALSETDTNLKVGKHYAECKMKLGDTNIVKSETINLWVDFTLT